MDPTMDPTMDLDLDFEFDMDVDLDSIPADGSDFSFLDPLGENGSTGGPSSERGSVTDSRPYHTKRPHKKSRAGCKQCKTRKVKCDEGRPACRNCTLRREKCLYPAPSASPRPAKASSAGSRSPKSPRSPQEQMPTPSESDARSEINSALVVSEPIFRPSPMEDMTDMRVLWFYTTNTFNSFSIEGGHSPVIDNVLKVKVVEHAFNSPFLMQCLLGLASLQMQSLNQEVPSAKAATYRARAFQGYRDAIEAARPTDFPALLACSLLMCALSSEMFRDPSSKPLYIVDWMTVWRGIGLIVEIITPLSMYNSGLAVLFFRPPIDLEKAARHIPNNLLFMVQSIKEGDADYADQQTYYATLKYLGSLYMELEKGFGPLLDLRIITFFTFIPKPFVPLAKEHRPRALIILAHYCAFTKLMVGPWWMRGIAVRQIREIREEVSQSWSHLLTVPQKVALLADPVEIAKEILDNNTWTAPEEDLHSGETRDPRIKELRLINNEGVPTSIVDGRWVLEAIEGAPDLLGALKLEGHEEGKQPSDEMFPIGPDEFGIGHLLAEDSPLSSGSSTLSPPPDSVPDSPGV